MEVESGSRRRAKWGVSIIFYPINLWEKHVWRNLLKIVNVLKSFAIFLFLQYPGLRWSYIFVINLSSYKTKISFENVKLNYINETTRLEWYANTYD